MALFPGQVICRGRGETMLREEPLRTQTVVLLYRPQHVSTGHAVSGHHVAFSTIVMACISSLRMRLLAMEHLGDRLAFTKCAKAAMKTNDRILSLIGAACLEITPSRPCLARVSPTSPSSRRWPARSRPANLPGRNGAPRPSPRSALATCE